MVRLASRLALVCALSLLPAACDDESSAASESVDADAPPAPPEPADTVLRKGRIYTLDSDQEWAESLARYLTELEPVGFDFMIHTVGDRAVRESLNAIEQAGSGSGRHMLTHVFLANPDDYPRFAELNVTADAQAMDDIDEEINPALGRERSMNHVALKSLRAAGARITLSSDWNVGSYNPFIGIHAAVNRRTQELSLAEALRAYTLDSAYVMRQEDRVGSLEEGKLADIVVLDRDLFEIAPETIKDAKVLLTMLEGRTVYRDPSF